MRIAQSFTAGLGRVKQSPALVAWLYLASWVVALPLALALRGILKEAIGASLVHQNLRQGFDLGWYGEFAFERGGLGTSFGPTVVGILPLLRNLERLLDGDILQVEPTLLLAGVVFLLAWAFFGGGILDRYARPEEGYARAHFFSQSGEYFFRFVRLLVLAGLVYWGLVRAGARLHRWVESATRDVTVERTVMAYSIGVYALVAFLLLLAATAFDYAKIAFVVEQRRSALLAFLRGLRFVLSRPAQTMGLALLLTGVGLALLLLYSVVAPGPGQSNWLTILLAFLVGQAYLLARLVLKLWFLSSQTVLFQSAEQSGQA